jgi:hypothetical protein
MPSVSPDPAQPASGIPRRITPATIGNPPDRRQAASCQTAPPGQCGPCEVGHSAGGKGASSTSCGALSGASAAVVACRTRARLDLAASQGKRAACPVDGKRRRVHSEPQACEWRRMGNGTTNSYYLELSHPWRGRSRADSPTLAPGGRASARRVVGRAGRCSGPLQPRRCTTGWRAPPCGAH